MGQIARSTERISSFLILLFCRLCRPNKRRQYKNDKFGFGGQKKRSKQNTKRSADDVSSFSVRRNAALPEKYKKRKQVCLLKQSAMEIMVRLRVELVSHFSQRTTKTTILSSTNFK